ncbi:MAG: polysaccharide export protein EpsE [Acidobacteria bacterium]|nr:polysaccharide export protein EpsE [Acidobacteriota bacterium]
MNITLLGKISLSALVFCSASLITVYGQESAGTVEKINFRYSQNPKTRSKPHAAASENNSSIAKKTLEVAKRASAASVSPTEIYKTGAGDILFINLQNAPKASTYYTILNDGTIDYPLAGEMVSVAGLTTDEIEETLKSKIKLYENPQISVKVREYASHTISVLGLVENPGEKKIQREAVPLYVIRAEAIVQPKATGAVIRRKDAGAETIDLKDSKADEVLIFPGDIVEFGSSEEKDSRSQANFFYIGGEVYSGGQKAFYPGITLTQAILASGGLRKTGVKKVSVRRKNPQGLLSLAQFNLKAIKDGKEPDPVLEPGDTIEVGN